MRNNKEFINDDDLMNSDNLVEEGDFVATTKGMLIKYKGSDKNLIIPSKVKGVKITMLGNGSDFFSILPFNYNYIYSFHFTQLELINKNFSFRPLLGIVFTSFS